jgi:hypothetical protein
MSNKFKFNGTFLWVIGVISVSMVVFVYLFVSDAPKTLPKIKLSYFVDEQEIATSVGKRLAQEIAQTQNYWIGIEPYKNEQIEVALQLKAELEKKTPFQKIIIDQELAFSEELLKKFSPTDVIFVKENVDQLGDILAKLENEKTSYLLITASIYSNSLLIQNPIHKIKEKHGIKPMTFSMAYMPTRPEDEGKMLFTCDTEDRSGAKDWACLVVSKSRFVRRKIKTDKDKLWTGLMDLSGERDYIILLNKKTISG